jgi:hypothetical protein
MASTSDFGSWRHLAGRFAGALLPHGPSGPDEAWARDQLTGGEQDLWGRMSGPDRRHAVGVARRAIAAIEEPDIQEPGSQESRLQASGGPAGASREFVAAALLHDVGKVEAALGTWARAAVTLVAMVAGRTRLIGWSAGVGAGWRRRVRLYLTHDQVGADLLVRAGSDPFTVAWAGEHHWPPARWTVDARLGDALKLADDD